MLIEEFIHVGMSTTKFRITKSTNVNNGAHHVRYFLDCLISLVHNRCNKGAGIIKALRIKHNCPIPPEHYGLQSHA